jgi:myosin protein heavy chain
VRELKEQIQSDDRLERAENSLKNTQNRADELEFQLSKLKQVNLDSPLVTIGLYSLRRTAF